MFLETKQLLTDAMIANIRDNFDNNHLNICEYNRRYLKHLQEIELSYSKVRRIKKNQRNFALSVHIFFDTSKSESIIDKLASLPEPMNSVIYTAYKDVKPIVNLVSRKKSFNAFRKRHPEGFFLYGNGFDHEIIISKTKKSQIIFNIRDQYFFHFIDYFFQEFSNLGIDFGFACQEAEYLHRHVYNYKTNDGECITWVGCDLSRYLSGLYWKTFVGNDLATLHEVVINKFARKAPYVVNLDSGFLITFFERPEEWRKYARLLNRLCKAQKGIFSIKRVPKVPKKADLFEEYKILRPWR